MWATYDIVWWYNTLSKNNYLCPDVSSAICVQQREATKLWGSFLAHLSPEYTGIMIMGIQDRPGGEKRRDGQTNKLFFWGCRTLIKDTFKYFVSMFSGSDWNSPWRKNWTKSDSLDNCLCNIIYFQTCFYKLFGHLIYLWVN